MRRSVFYVMAAGIAIVAACALWYVIDRHGLAGCLASLRSWYQSGLRLIQAAPPGWFWLGLTLLPLVGLPVAPLFVAAGLRFSPLTAVVLAASSIFINLLLSHYIASRWLRGLVSKLLVRFGYREPTIPNGQHRQATLLLRITPGIPVSVGNYLLPLGGVSLGVFLAISFPIQFGFACGFIFLGRSLAGDGLLWALLAVAMIIVLKFVLRRKSQSGVAASSAVQSRGTDHNSKRAQPPS